MTTQEAREVFNKAAAAATTPEAVARIEICREYFTNPAFKAWMEGYVAKINGVA